MNANIEAQLNEAKRDALVDFYLGHVIPKKDDALAKKVHTAEDLYAYLLIDPLISSTVRTSKVAEGIASLQLYLNRLVQRREPNTKVMPDEVRQWQENDSRYAVWAGNRALETYPENYLNPTLRKSKTALFKQLETRLNQGRINKDEAQSAVLDYLNDFEEVSNLEVISGYEARIEQMVYFIGRTKNKPHKYYWRSLNLAKHPDVKTEKILFPTAWTEWKPLDAAVGNAMDSLVCPIFMNGRLYIAWCESAAQEGVASAAGQEATFIASEGNQTQLILNKPIQQSGTFVRLAFKRFDDSWSAPLELKNLPADKEAAYFSAYVDVDQGKEELYLLLGLDTNEMNECNVYKYDALLNDISTKGETFDLSNLGKQAQEALKTLEALKILKRLKALEKQETLKAVNVLKKLQKIGAEEGGKFKELGESIIKIDLISLIDKLDKINELNAKKKEEELKKISLLEKLKTLKDLEAAQEIEAQGTKIVMHGHNSQDQWQVVLGAGIGTGELALRDYLALTTTPQKNNGSTKVTVEVTMRPYIALRVSSRNPRVKLTHIVIKDKDGKELDKAEAAPGNGPSTAKVNFTLFHAEKQIGIIEGYFSIPGMVRRRPFVVPIFSMPPAKDSQYLTINTKVQSAPQKSAFVQYLKFPKEMAYSPIRLNTLFAKTLIKNANVGIDAVLGFSAQNITEPNFNGSETNRMPMDFQGANSLYFWELFFHMPFLVAHRLNLEQRFDEATQWLHYLFSPSDIHGNYWRMQGLLEDGADAEMIGPGAVDPDELAMVYPIHYRKAVFFAYIKNLLDQGDACYRELTRESLGEAKQWYLQACALLGEVPTTKVARKWVPHKLQKLVENHASNKKSVAGAFSLPLNKALHDYWQKIDTRLYNLRHSLTLDGKPLNLPLFDAPLDPMELLAARSRGGSGGTRLVTVLPIPPLRFSAMMSKAMGAVEMLIQFGNALQSTLERKDAAELERLQHVQQGELLGFTVELQDLTIEMGKKTLEGLTLSKESAMTRESYYQRLFNENTSAAEDQVRVLRGTASGVAAGAPALRAAGAAASMVPNIYGVAAGGSEFSGPFYATADGLLCESEVTSLLANQMEISEQYRRRAEEWELQSKLATVDVKQIDQQIAAQKQQLELFKKQKAQIKAQQKHLQANYDFLTSRFTAESLYQWMAGQLAALYFQAYDSVVSLCLLSEAAWQYETGDYEAPRFIQTGAWQDLYRGLLAGEMLKLALHRMDQAYLTRNERKLEIVHTVSLKKLFESRGEKWEEKLKTLKTSSENGGSITFSLTEQDFDKRYPGHYLRQIVTVSVSLPAVIGPYQDVRAILTQTKSDVIVKPDAAAIKYLFNSKDPEGSQTAVKSNLRASQQIALSTGIGDSGLFYLNFGDERYLPFEGTGAVSEWQLTFPEHTDEVQKTLLESLTDIIVCIRYTAKDGGKAFGVEVSKLVKKNEGKRKESH